MGNCCKPKSNNNSKYSLQFIKHSREAKYRPEPRPEPLPELRQNPIPKPSRNNIIPTTIDEQNPM